MQREANILLWAKLSCYHSVCLEHEGLGRVRGVVGMCGWKQRTSYVPVGLRLLVGGLCALANAVMV